MINVYHRDGYDCVVAEQRDDSDGSFIHFHKSAGHMALYEIVVTTKEAGVLFQEIIPQENECDQSRRR